MSDGIDEADRPQVLQGAGTDLFSKFDPLIELRRSLLATGQEDPFSLVMERVVSPTVAVCNGRETILLGTYNYMGMTFDPDVIEAGKQALEDFGAGTTGSRVLNGTYAGHKAVAFKQLYTPLELITESNFGPESDLFELSMMIYEMLTGKLPPPSLQRAMTIDSWIPTDVPENWRKLLSIGLQLKREDRPKDLKNWWQSYSKGGIIVGKRRVSKIVIGNNKRSQ